ncbi:DUF2536 family protein [Paenibacillus thermoaerophilus]|uniref:DUF2536 family protein n=1 Tax=Paenibacillus thermoaerophilus TaxID=1215385 RepID=A0ABW2V3I5_9BACL|nr:DUF2536 family protein [Paenibacillus thermoaerophilus]TMV12026.1 DUF2536 family protein [Paenibacillus thermoaerophilus]
MSLIVERLETKIEFFEAHDIHTLEQKIDEQIQNNKALLLDVHAVQHQVAFNPVTNRMHYTAVVHFRAK